ncbi:DUF4328 domain-containing protein [Streptomyces sp. NPDC059247]|uniref:DUF4328 domain-containing protein n=1 Tax=Streptomyces sp. NPDC059247 TaxID=3346790 RepID=UPI003679BEA1
MLRNPTGLAHAVTALLGATVVIDLFSLFTTSELQSAVTGRSADDLSPLVFATGLVGVAALLQILALVATATLFVIWFHRLRQNAGVWAGDIQRRTPGWAIGAWFIPFANLWIPRGIAEDIWRASRAEPTGADRPRELLLLNGWWAAFVIDAVVGRVASRTYERADGLEEHASAVYWLYLSDALSIVAAVLAIFFVRRLTSMQHAKATGMIPAAD